MPFGHSFCRWKPFATVTFPSPPSRTNAAASCRALFDRRCRPTCTTRPVFCGHLDHSPPFPLRQRERLLYVYILARIAGIHKHQRMPVVRCRDHYGINVLVLKQLVIILIPGRVPAGFPGRKIQVVVPEVADGDRRSIAELEVSFVDLIAAVSEADVAHLHAVVRTDNTPVTGGGDCCGCTYEGSATRWVHTAETLFTIS